MEDGAKVHMGYANDIRAHIGFKGFVLSWPLLSPDLNPIEKVWRWMKGRICQMEPFPTTLEELKAAVQQLWDEMDPCAFIKHIENIYEKLEEVIRQRGFATKY